MSNAIKTEYPAKIKEIDKHIEKLENEKRIINGKLKVLRMQRDELEAKINQ